MLTVTPHVAPKCLSNFTPVSLKVLSNFTPVSPSLSVCEQLVTVYKTASVMKNITIIVTKMLVLRMLGAFPSIDCDNAFDFTFHI